MNQSHVIEDEHLHKIAALAEDAHAAEMQGGKPEWPTCAALNYWHMAQTARRFLALPHSP